MALSVAAASSCVLLFGVYEAQRDFACRSCRWSASGYLTPIAGDVCTAVALSVAAVSSYVLLFGAYEIHACTWPAVCSPFHVFSYASLGDLSVRLLKGYEGLGFGPLVLYKNFTRRCCCLLYTRHLRFTRLFNLARGGLSMSRVSYASLLICPYCCLEDTRYTSLFRVRHCPCVCTAVRFD